MDTTAILWITVATAIGTFLLRLSFIQVFANREVPPILEQILRYVPSAAVSAIIVPAIVFTEETLDVSLGNERLIAGLLALVIAVRTRSFPLTVGIGMATFWLLRAVM